MILCKFKTVLCEWGVSSKLSVLSFLFSISNSLCYKYVISNTTLHYTAFLIYTRYKYESVSASLEEQKEIELSLNWIRSESHVNLNRAPRKLYLSLKPIWNETYFIVKWSLLQWQMKPIAMTNEVCFDSKLSFFAIYHGWNREGWSRNRERCVMNHIFHRSGENVEFYTFLIPFLCNSPHFPHLSP